MGPSHNSLVPGCILFPSRAQCLDPTPASPDPQADNMGLGSYLLQRPLCLGTGWRHPLRGNSVCFPGRSLWRPSILVRPTVWSSPWTTGFDPSTTHLHFHGCMTCSLCSVRARMALPECHQRQRTLPLASDPVGHTKITTSEAGRVSKAQLPLCVSCWSRCL